MTSDWRPPEVPLFDALGGTAPGRPDQGVQPSRAKRTRTRGRRVSGMARLESRWTRRQLEMSAGAELTPVKGVPVWRDRLGYLVLGVLLGMAATLWLLNQLGLAPNR